MALVGSRQCSRVPHANQTAVVDEYYMTGEGGRLNLGP